MEKLQVGRFWLWYVGSWRLIRRERIVSRMSTPPGQSEPGWLIVSLNLAFTHKEYTRKLGIGHVVVAAEAPEDPPALFVPILDCSFQDADDGCCSHPDNFTPECHFDCCPRLEKLRSCPQISAALLLLED